MKETSVALGATLEKMMNKIGECPAGTAILVRELADFRTMERPGRTYALVIQARFGVAPGWESPIRDEELAELLEIPEEVVLDAFALAGDVVKYRCQELQASL